MSSQQWLKDSNTLLVMFTHNDSLLDVKPVMDKDSNILRMMNNQQWLKKSKNLLGTYSNNNVLHDVKPAMAWEQ